MPNTDLTQDEAEMLLALEKHRTDDRNYEYPGTGGSVRVPLVSADGREAFILDITRGRIDLLKGTYQNRARAVVILARLDFGGAPHRNPDDAEIPCPHLHVYREGYGDKWAIPIPQSDFSNADDRWQLLMDFMRFVRITRQPNIVRGMFS